MTILAKLQRSLISSVQKLTVTDIQCLKLFVTMSKLIYQLYNDNMISEEVVHLLLDAHYNRISKKRYK